MNERGRMFVLAVCAAALAGGAAAEENVSPDADFTAREITQALFKARPGEQLNYSGRDLTYLDLSGLDFKQARLDKTDLYGADLTGANLKGADISNARLDRAVLIRADMSGANLRGTTILRPTVYSDMENKLSDAPRFAGANLTGIHVQAELSGADFRGADLTYADFSPLEARPGQGTLVTLPRNVLKSCDFSGATLAARQFHARDSDVLAARRRRSAREPSSRKRICRKWIFRAPISRARISRAPISTVPCCRASKASTASRASIRR